MITVKRFTASWCAPCKMLAPMFKQMQQELPDVEFKTFDIDEHPQEALLETIRSVPTVLISNSDNGKTISLVGANPKTAYLNAMEAVKV